MIQNSPKGVFSACPEFDTFYDVFLKVCVLEHNQGVFPNTTRRVLEHNKACFATQQGAFWNTTRRVLEHNTVCFGTQQGVFWNTTRRVLERKIPIVITKTLDRLGL